MGFLYRREIPIGIGIILTSVILIQYFTTNPSIENVSKEFQLWGVIIAAYAMLLGFLSYVLHHGNQVIKRQSAYSGWALLTAFGTIILGLLTTTSSASYQFLTSNILTPLSMAMGSYLGFFICAAAFRSFRARNLEAAALLFSATVIMLKNIPIGNVIIPGIHGFGNWYNDVVAFGGNRGLIIVMGVGMIVAGIRQLLGYERGDVGG
jgi:hypothetical protein